VTVLLLHGVMSAAHDWRKQVPALQQAGCNIIAPDLLGYGGTDKPLAAKEYAYSAMAADLLDILAAEGAGKTAVISHDWGSVLTTYLANYHAERFVGFAFIGIGYGDLLLGRDYSGVMKVTKESLGYELYGYWKFFTEDGAHEVLREHWDAFYSVMHPIDPAAWKVDVGPLGGLKARLLADKVTPLPAYLTQADKQRATEALLGGVGLAGALNWYKLMIQGAAGKENGNVKKQHSVIQQPVFFGGAMQDYICISSMYKAEMPKLCPDLTVKEYERDHWLLLDRPEKLNRDLVEWISDVAAKV